MSGDAPLNRDEGSRRAQLLKGLAELALLSLLRDGPQYGLAILDRLRLEGGLQLAEGTIYPLLHRLEKANCIRAQWRIEEAGTRPRKYYALTKAGSTELELLTSEWQKVSGALGAFLARKSTRHDRHNK